MKNKTSKNTKKNKTNKVPTMKSSVKHTEKPAVAFNGVHKLPQGEQQTRGLRSLLNESSGRALFPQLTAAADSSRVRANIEAMKAGQTDKKSA